MIRVVTDKATLRALCDAHRSSGGKVSVVPTMGALHRGHFALVDAARRHGDLCIVTVFVNPTQFGPKEDFAAYPRTLESDVAACEAQGVDVVFAPSSSEMYPPGFDTVVDVGVTAGPLEGAHRPGHFRGVATVVTKLLALTAPCTAVFGRKDYQQWRVIERLVQDLELPATVLAAPTVREPDGLALSSRNAYLSSDE